MLISQSLRDVCTSHAGVHPNENYYLLIDHAGIPGLVGKLHYAKLEWISLFEGTTQANALSVAPLLILIGPASQKICNGGFLTSVCESGAYSSCLMLIASPLSLSVLASRLAARLDAKISEDMEVLLRFFDPRVFEQLVQYLSAQQRTDFLSAGSAWWFVDRQGELQAVDAHFSPAEAFQSPLLLSARQEHELLDASEFDQVEEQLRLSVPRELSQVMPPKRYEFISRQMTAAREFGINSTRELSLYCALAFVYGADFSDLPEWSSQLSLIREGKHDLTSLVSSLSEPQEELERQ